MYIITIFMHMQEENEYFEYFFSKCLFLKACHPERSEAESKDLRTIDTSMINSVRRSFDSLMLALDGIVILAIQQELPSPSGDSRRRWGADGPRNHILA